MGFVVFFPLFAALVAVFSAFQLPWFALAGLEVLFNEIGNLFSSII